MKKSSQKFALWFGGIILLLVLLWFASQASRPAASSIEGVQKISDMGNTHIESVDAPHPPYNSNPPTSGPHVGNIASWGVYTEMIRDEQQVHNLEDGGVIAQYNPDKLPKDQWKRLEETVIGTNRKHVIVAPRYDMEYTIALTAWNRLLPLETVDEEKITSFIRAFEGIDHHK